MTLKKDAAAPRRRRGAALEDALLAAVWAELTTTGYGALTIDAVAARAGTSRAVLYRRWPGKAELVRAAIEWEVRSNPTLIPDTGSLRGDVVALLVQTNEGRARLATELMPHLAEYWRDTGTNLKDLHTSVFGGHGTFMRAIVERAAARGEVDASAVTDRMANLPVDLYRHEVLTTLAPVPSDVIEEIVDTIFLPLVTRRCSLRDE